MPLTTLQSEAGLFHSFILPLKLQTLVTHLPYDIKTTWPSGDLD